MALRNPIVGGCNPDPSVCVVGDDIYMANSSFAYFPGVPLYHSRDLVHWRQIGNILDRPSQLNLTGANINGGIYAPTLRFHDGRFWMVTTNHTNGGNFLVHAERPEGPWSEPVWIDVGTFDPDLCWDENGTCWYCRSEKGIAIVQAPINPMTGKLLAPLKPIWENAEFFGIEGPHLYHIGDWWYLLVAGGGGCTRAEGHLVAVARSRSPEGPFSPCPFNPVLTQRDRMMDIIQATGHGDLFQTADGRWWIVFLGWRNYGGLGHGVHPLGRETFLSPVDWRDGWPVPRVPALEMEDPGFKPCPWETNPVRDDFDAPTLGPAWLYLRAPGCATLQERPGWLRVKGDGLVGRRQEHPWSRTTCRLEARTGQGEAGLALFLNERSRVELGLRDGKAFVRRYTGDWHSEEGHTAVPDGPLDVELVTNPWACMFTVRKGEEIVLQFKLMTWALSFSSGTMGVIVMLYTRNAEMDVDWFEHRGWRSKEESGLEF